MIYVYDIHLSYDCDIILSPTEDLFLQKAYVIEDICICVTLKVGGGVKYSISQLTAKLIRIYIYVTLRGGGGCPFPHHICI